MLILTIAHGDMMIAYVMSEHEIHDMPGCADKFDRREQSHHVSTSSPHLGYAYAPFTHILPSILGRESPVVMRTEA